MTKSQIIKNSSRRAVSEIIVTLLLLGITIVAGTLVWVTLSGSTEQLSLQTEDILEPSGSERDIILVGYDTRDGADIGGFTNIDNSNDGALRNNEFIVLKLRDRLDGDILIDKVLINQTEHVWCSTSSTPTCDASITLTSALVLSDTPSEGQFIIINGTNPDHTTGVNLSQIILEGADFRLLVKLETDLADIAVNKPIRVGVVVVGFDPTFFVISSGGTR